MLIWTSSDVNFFNYSVALANLIIIGMENGINRLIKDEKSNLTYRRGTFLGKGGFARCYEFKNITTGEIFAGKVITKTRWMKLRPQEIVPEEIKIHSSLSHQHIVSFQSYFEDESNIYIIMELCHKRSLMEMHKRRKSLSVSEVRYFMWQLTLACKYLHDSKVIHRDLKPQNLYISDNMEIKIGDFGLATRIRYKGERRKTICGTPNYIAPEILTRKGHSFEVDIWSLGCIMYALLVGSPPFETNTLKKTFRKIKKCDYYLPPRLDRRARQLIQKLLHPNPAMRPKADIILMDNFFRYEPIPFRLPKTCLFFSSYMSLSEILKISRRRTFQERVGNFRAIIPDNEVVEAEVKREIAAAKVKSEIAADKGEKDFKNQSQLFRYLDWIDLLISVSQKYPEMLTEDQP